MRFHVYFTVRIHGREKMSDISNECNSGEIYQNNDHIRRKLIYEMFPWETHTSINKR